MGEDRALPRFEAVLKSMEQYLQPLFPLLSCPPEPRYCPGLPPEGLRHGVPARLLEPWGRRGTASLCPHRCAQVPSSVTPRARVGGQGAPCKSQLSLRPRAPRLADRLAVGVGAGRAVSSWGL